MGAEAEILFYPLIAKTLIGQLNAFLGLHEH